MKKVMPNYKDGSIVNLMSSIFASFGKKKRKYNSLKILSEKELKEKNNVILLVIDGLGHNYLMKNGKNTFMHKNLRGKITSVFPATTATAITTFSTGLAPAEHGIPGWDLFSKEIGSMVEILIHKDNNNTDFNKIIYDESIFTGMNIKPYRSIDKRYDSEYNNLFNKYYEKLNYSNLRTMFSNMGKLLKKKSKNRRYIFAYWPMIDGYLHIHGTESNKVKAHMIEIDKKVKAFVKSIKNTDTTLIITADHGLNNIKKRIILNDHPKFIETLAFPPAGDARVKYCFLKNGKEKEFENYVNTKFKNYCEIKKSSDLLKENYFGFPPFNKKLVDRIGDYTLIAKNDCIFKYVEPGKVPNKFKGHHSGMSEDEMYVPLIVINSE